MLQDYVVYGDVLLFLNFVLDYFLLWATGRFMRLRINYGRIAVASAVGGLYGLGLVFFQFSVLYSLPATVLVSLLLLFIAFPIRNLLFLIKTAGVLYIIGFAMAGAALGGQAVISGWEESGLVKAGVLVFSLGIAVMVAHWGMKHFRRNWRKENFKAELEIVVNDRCCRVTALIDTGNDLSDPLSGQPAVIVEASALSGIFPLGLYSDIQHYSAQSPAYVMERCQSSFWRRRLRLLPFHSIGNTSGMLLGFKPDRLLIDNGERIETAEVVICFSAQKIGNSLGCRAIVNPAVITGGREQVTGIVKDAKNIKKIKEVV